jgi:hypothetical protein
MNKLVIECLFSAMCLTGMGDAFVASSPLSRKSLVTSHWQAQAQAFSKSSQALAAQDPSSSSYDVDTDEEAEQHMGEKPNSTEDPVVTCNGGPGPAGRYDDLISAVGLEGTLKHVNDLPAERKVGMYDIFCNRELQQEGIGAIGFDMDYTLAQYKQPAFDKLAFDGARDKLVKTLGYPEEVLAFEYDHEVRHGTNIFSSVRFSHFSCE